MEVVMFTVEDWAKRLSEIEAAIVNATNQVYTLQGHKSEAQYHLEEAKKAQEPEESVAVSAEQEVQ
jgi:hypothetical protein